MARIKELREKVAQGTATDEEVKELSELETEAKEVKAETKEDNMEDAIDKMADTLVEKVSAKLQSKAEEKSETKVEEKSTVVVGETPRFVIDKKLGRVAPEKLEEVKIELPGRKAAGKKQTEVSAKTIHFLHALQTNNREKLQILSEGTAAAGGYLVPEDFLNVIVEDLRDATVMRQLATTINVTTDTVHLPRLDTRPQAQWRAEKAVKATSTAQFSELVLTPYSLAAIVPLTQELVDDATLGVNGSIVNYIAGLMTQAIAEKQDKAFWTGSGSGQPTGVSGYSVGSRAKGSNFADTIINIYHDMKQGYRNRSVWVANSYVLAQLRQLKDTQNRYLVQDLGQTPYGSLLGRPMYEQNDLAQSELYFGDFSYYYIADRQGVRVDTSTEATVGGSNAFEKNLVFVRTECRVDGELTLTEAVKKITNI